MKMTEINKSNTRYYWVDNLKFSCCILVVLGHFYMSMISAGILPDNLCYNLTIKTMYTFHVPVFFVCSGFLYQKSNKVHSFKSWYKNVLDKLLNLGVPYFTFTAITLLMKNIFADSVNNPAGDTLYTLFIHPTAPYWYLYALFFMFVFIPCLNTKKQSVALLIFALVAKIFCIICTGYGIAIPYIIYSTLSRMIWLVLGITLSFDIIDLKSKPSKAVMIVCAVLAVVISVCLYKEQSLSETQNFIIGLLFVIAIIIASQNYAFTSLNKLSSNFSEYFMPVYVMHTIACAGVRILLIKIGVLNPVIHIIAGVISGFLLPIIAYKIAKKIPIFLFFIYPKKAIKEMKARKTNEQH